MSLTEHVLEGMVENTILVDRLVPKTFETGVVVQFEVEELDAAYDLSSFLERSTPLSLDTEVSDYPNKDGFYMVFIELERTPNVSDTILKMLTYADRLCNNNEWFYLDHNGNKVKISKETLDKAISSKENEMLRLFLDKAEAKFTLNDENTLTIWVNNAKYVVEYVDIKTNHEVERLISREGIDLSNTKKLDRFCKHLGPMYEGIATKNSYIVSKKNSNKNLVIRF